MIEEQRRRAYLRAMQITSWLPRQPLPFAAPSSLELLKLSSCEIKQLAEVASAPLAERREILISLPKPGVPEVKKMQVTSVEEASAKAPVVQALPPRFVLQLLLAGPCALLVELPIGEPFANRDPEYLLLKDLLRAAGLPDCPRLIGDPVRWPLLARGNFDQGSQAALEFVQSFVGARLEEQDSQCLWLVGLPAIRYAGGSDETSFFHELQIDGFGVAWALPGLERLIGEPLLKGEVWRAMRCVRQRWVEHDP